MIIEIYYTKKTNFVIVILNFYVPLQRQIKFHFKFKTLWKKKSVAISA